MIYQSKKRKLKLGHNTPHIAAFKRHYRRLHLQNALDRNERNETNLYKVDQFTAMRWSLAAWSEISSTTIKNCFDHTGLMDGLIRTEGGQELGTGAVDQEDHQEGASALEEQLVEEELASALERLPLRNPMSIAYLLNPDEEEESAHSKLTDAEIIKLVQQPEEDEVDATEEEEVQHTKAEKLGALGLTISLLDLSKETHHIAYHALRALQSDLRTVSTTQTTLDSWLN